LPPTSLPLVPEARTALVKVPVTEQEKRLLVSRAAAEGRSVAEYVRLRLATAASPREPNPLANVKPAAVAVTMRDEARMTHS
jgi:hypothetical protein